MVKSRGLNLTKTQLNLRAPWKKQDVGQFLDKIGKNLAHSCSSQLSGHAGSEGEGHLTLLAVSRKKKNETPDFYLWLVRFRLKKSDPASASAAAASDNFGDKASLFSVPVLLNPV